MKLFLVSSILLLIACEVVSVYRTDRPTEGPETESDIHGMPFTFQSTEEEIDQLFIRTPHRERVTPPQLRPGEDPDCFIERCVITRKGGKCSRVRGGLSYCAVDGVLYMDNPYCDNIGRPNHSRMPKN